MEAYSSDLGLVSSLSMLITIFCIAEEYASLGKFYKSMGEYADRICMGLSMESRIVVSVVFYTMGSIVDRLMIPPTVSRSTKNAPMLQTPFPSTP